MDYRLITLNYILFTSHSFHAYGCMNECAYACVCAYFCCMCVEQRIMLVVLQPLSGFQQFNSDYQAFSLNALTSGAIK